MVRIACIGVSVVALALTACSGGAGTGGSGGGGSGGAGGGTGQCNLSSQCELGEICEGGQCTPFTGCPDTPCTGNEFCDTDQTCKDPVVKCDTDGCSCKVVDALGGIPAAGVPTLTLVPGGELVIRVMVSSDAGGGWVPGVGLLDITDADLTDASNAFNPNADGTGIVANAVAGVTSATLTVHLDGPANDVSCDANLINLGNAPATGIRVYAFDDLTGAPVENAHVVVEDGVLGAPLEGDTDADGIFSDATVLAATRTVTVFAYDDNGTAANFADDTVYNYVTLVGITASDLAVPLSARRADPSVGGWTGKIDFGAYEDRYLDGQEKLIKAAIASNSIPLQSLLNFDLSVLVGELPDVECPDTGALPAGCYELQIPSIDPIRLPLPGGIQMHLSGTAAKGSVDVVGVPGTRTAWTLGGEIDIGDIAPLAPILLELSNCTTDCQIDVGGIFGGVLPMLASFGSGLQADVPLVATLESDWHAYIAVAYASRVENADYPTLDDRTTFNDDRGPLSVAQALDKFSDFTAPSLPDDSTGQSMEAMLVLTGVNGPGGFVPLGLTAGLDCTTGSECLDRVANPTEFDGEVNGGEVCKFSTNATSNRCPRSVPSALEGHVADGHMGLFHAPAHGGLDQNSWLTVVAALPLTSLISGAAGNIETTAFVLRAEPGDGASSQLTSRSFLPVPTLDDNAAARVYDIQAVAGADLHWITYGSETSVDTGLTTRWNVYVASGTASFTLPDPAVVFPAGVDPTAFQADVVEDPEGDEIAQGKINVTHIAFDLAASSPSLSEFAANDGDSLVDIIQHVDALAISSGDICASSGVVAECP